MVSFAMFLLTLTASTPSNAPKVGDIYGDTNNATAAPKSVANPFVLIDTVLEVDDTDKTVKVMRSTVDSLGASSRYEAWVKFEHIALKTKLHPTKE